MADSDKMYLNADTNWGFAGEKPTCPKVKIYQVREVMLSPSEPL